MARFNSAKPSTRTTNIAGGKAFKMSTPLELILSATVATKVVLVVLAVLSLVSWGVMLSKWLEFSRVAKASASFLSEFSRASRLEQVAGVAKRVKPSPYTRVFARAIQFLQETRPLGVDDTAGGGTLSGSQVEALRLVLDAETLVETRYVIANATRTLSPFVQSILFSDAGNKRLRVSYVSNVSDVDRASPYIAWAERLTAHLIVGQGAQHELRGRCTHTPPHQRTNPRLEFAGG